MALTKIIRGLFLVVIFLIVSPLFLVYPQAVQAEEPEVNGSEVEYWAVIVGVKDYQGGDTVMINVSDAEDLYGELAPIWGQDHIRLLVSDEATKENIQEAICSWLDDNEDSNDVALFYFSGHGNGAYLSTYDNSMNSYDNHVSLYELKSWLDGLESNGVVVILDSCLSGSFIAGLSKPGRIIITSSKIGQESWYYPNIGNCIFTYYILDALDNSSEVDINQDYEICVEEIFSFAEYKVVEHFEDKWQSQNPQMDDGYYGDLNFFYYVTIDIDANIDLDSAADYFIVNVDGIMRSALRFPMTFRWKPYSEHSFIIYSTDSAWASSSSFTISKGGEYRFVYLDVESEKGEPVGEGWYEEGTAVNVSVDSPLGVISRDVFTGWSGDINDSSSEATIYVDRPMSITANWQKDYSQLYMLIGGFIAALAVIAVPGAYLFIRKRRKVGLTASPTEAVLPSAHQDGSVTSQ